MHGSRRTRRSGVAFTTALLTATLLAVPATAGAATDTTSIVLKGQAATSLKRHHVKLSGRKPAKASSKRITLPVSSGSVRSKHATLRHRGRLKLKVGKRSVTLKHVRVKVGKKSKVTAKIGRSTITLLTLKPAKKRPAQFDVKTKSVHLKGATARLPKKTAKTLRKKLHLRSLASGSYGKVTVTAYLGKVPNPPVFVTPRPVPIDGGDMTYTPPGSAKPIPPACPTAEGQFTTGLQWGVKSSFLGYIQGPGAKGKVWCSDGATGEKAGDKVTALRFADTNGGIYDPATGTVDVALAGTVRFSGHNYGQGPLLNLTLSNLRIRSTDGVSGELVANVRDLPIGAMNPAAPPPPAEERPNQVIAELDLDAADLTDASGTWTWSNVPATLTADGADAFGNYPAGTPLESLTFTAKQVAAELEWTQVRSYSLMDPPNVNKTWLGYVTAGAPIGTNGTMTPSNGATGDTVTSSSPAGAAYKVRYPGIGAYNAGAGTGTIWTTGVVTFNSAAHGFNITVERPRIEFDGGNTAQLFASGEGPSATYEDSAPLFDLDLSGATTTDNGDGTSTISDIAPVLATAETAFPGDYAIGDGPDRTPNTFGSFSLTVPTS